MQQKLVSSQPSSTAGLFKFNRRRSQRYKKVRGAFRRIARAVADPRAFAIKLDAEGWFNYWHQHLDWRGLGNNCSRIRLVFLEGHARLFRHLASQEHLLGKPFQLWITLSIEDAGHDAVFMHTANPHTAFPAYLGCIEWDLPVLKELFAPWMPEYDLTCGRSKGGLFLYAEGVGLPLRQPLA